MVEVVDQWIGEWAPFVSRAQSDSSLSGALGHSKAQETIDCLTKNGVREGRNKRQGESTEGGYSGGYSSGKQTGGSYGGSSIQQSKTGSPLRYYDLT